MGAKAVFVVQKCVVQKNQGCLGLFLEKSAPPQLEAGQQADRTDGSSRLMRWPAATKARQSPAISRWQVGVGLCSRTRCMAAARRGTYAEKNLLFSGNAPVA